MASLADRVSPLGVAFFTWLSITGWTAISLVCTPLFLLSLIPVPEVAQVTKPLYRKATNFVQWAWMGNVAFLLEYLFNMRVSVLCDQKTKDNEDKLMSGERSIWTSTHRTRVDWMLLWNLALRTRSLAQLKIVLKAPLRVLPIFGWAMQHFLFIFLNRRWSEDEAMLKSYLPFLNSREPQSSFLIFPEGTDLSDSNLDKSNEFAKKSGLPPRFYSLYPRTKGWTYMFPKIRGSLDAVYDITIFYIDHAPHERVSEGAFISGRMPQRVIFYVERTEVKDMPTSETDLATWVETSFERKEKHLKAFNENNGKLPHGAQAVKFPDPMASFSLIIVFWLWFVTIATRLAWACGWWSIYFAIVVAAGHAIVEVALGGVDSILRKTL